jgi:hypothetical protein
MKHRLRGFALSQLLIDAFVIFGLVAVLLTVTMRFVSAGSTEDARLRCVAANVSAIELIKHKFCESGDIEESLRYTADDGEYSTSITKIHKTEQGASEIYKLTVDTMYRGNYLIGTGMVVYIAAN